MSDAPFSSGQYVRCIHEDGSLNKITKGNIYRVARCVFDAGLGQWCVEIEGNAELWYAKRFVAE
jgi:hypothetical protein